VALEFIQKSIQLHFLMLSPFLLDISELLLLSLDPPVGFEVDIVRQWILCRLSSSLFRSRKLNYLSLVEV
jgi:hypothetical protein